MIYFPDFVNSNHLLPNIILYSYLYANYFVSMHIGLLGNYEHQSIKINCFFPAEQRFGCPSYYTCYYTCLKLINLSENICTAIIYSICTAIVYSDHLDSDHCDFAASSFCLYFAHTRTFFFQISRYSLGAEKKMR